MQPFRLIVVSLVFITLLIGVTKIVPTSNHRIFFEHNDPQLITLDSLKEAYGSTNNIVITLVEDNATILQPKTLAIMSELQEKLEQLPAISTLESILTQPKITVTAFGIKQSNLIPKPYDSISSQSLNEIQTTLINSSLYLNLFIDSTAHATGIHCTFNLEDAPEGYAETLRDTIPQLVTEAFANTSVSHYITGGLFIDGVFTEAGLRDSRSLTPVMIGVILLILWGIYRSPRLLLAFSLAVFPTPMLVMGVAGWLGIPFSPSLAVVPIIVLAISTATSIHVITAYGIALQHEHLGKTAMHRAITRCRSAITFTAITTIVGFLTLNISKTPPFRVMGNLAAFGTLLALFNALYILPQLLLLLKAAPPKRMPAFFNRIQITLTRFIVKSPKRVVLYFGLFLLLTLPGLWKLRANDSFINYFDTRFQFRRDTEKTIEHLTGIDYLQLSLTAKSSITDSSYLYKLLEMTQWCEQDPRVRHVLSLPQVIQENYKSISKDADGALPPTKTLEHFISNMSTPKNQRSFKHAKEEATQIFVLFDKLSSQELLLFAHEAEIKATELFGKKNILMGSTSLLFANLSLTNSKAMHQGMLLSLFFITIILFVITRRFLWGILTIIPNILPVLFSFGLWGLYMQKSGLGLSIVAPMSLGIIVDDTVHFITHYSRFRKKGFSPIDAITKTYHELTNAVISTTLILAAGFLTLTISGFQPTKEMGLLSAFTIVFALLGDLLLLPALLMICDKEKKEES